MKTKTSYIPLKKIKSKINLEIYKTYIKRMRRTKKFINKYTSINTMNWIEDLSINQKVKEFLYESAGLPKGNSKRLTHDDIKITKRFLKQEPRFNSLTYNQQMNILVCIINHKDIHIDMLKSIVDDYCKISKVM